MKTGQWILAVALMAILALVGCSKQSSVDTAPLQNSFKSADPAAQSAADKVVAAVKAQDYSGAASQLQDLAKNVKLTPEQQQAVKDVLAQVQKALTDAASKAAGDATKAAGDLQKSLPK